MLQEWQTRVLVEFGDLDEKVIRLDTFIHGQVFKTLDSRSQNLLRAQLNIMRAYLVILQARAEAFDSPTGKGE